MSQQLYLPTITLWQPWASWIALGWKPIETRTHPMFKHLLEKRIGIHAGLRWDADAIGIASEWLTLEQQHRSEEFRSVRGALVCTAHVWQERWLGPEDSRGALIDCDNVARHGLFLSDVRGFEPIPMKGMQGVWNAAPHLADHQSLLAHD